MVGEYAWEVHYCAGTRPYKPKIKGVGRLTETPIGHYIYIKV